MPAITPNIVSVGGPNGVPCVVWETITPGDTGTPYLVRDQYGLAGAVQISGTFGGATIALEQSNDGVTYFPLKDSAGVAVSAGTATIFEVSTSAVYIRPTIIGGTSSDVDIYVALRG